MRNNGSRRGTSKKERDYIEYDGGRMTRNGLSANHLLNFQLPEREKTHAHAHGKKKKAAGPVRTQMEYLHANYRFVIAPLADEGDAVACWDIETLTEWNAVEQVLLWYDESSPATCPICLDDFRAPKITRCGHIFCWPCILRYLSMTDKYWRRCPMCFDSVQKGQLRSVRLESVQLPPRVDASATFQFLQRAKASLFPHVRDPHESLTARRKRVRKLPTVYDEEAKYARILESTHEYLLHLAMGEMRDLQALDAESRSSGDVDALPFIEEAMKATSQRLAGVEANHAKATPAAENADSKFQSLEGLAPSDMYSFYQQQNGCYVVLHPLNMKCLTKEFADTTPSARKASVDGEQDGATAVMPLEDAWAGASSPPGSARFEPSTALQYDRLPSTIQGRVIEVEHLVMDEAVQKRFRFLGHLPKFCDFYVCELDLSELLSPATLEAFRPEIKKREKQRRAKKDTEKRGRSKQHGNGASPKSPPLYSEYSAMRGFSLADGEAHWPAPSEMSLSDAFHDGLQLHEADDLANRSAAPSPATFSLADYLPASSDASFATITRNSGYYPPLGGASAASDRDVTSSPSMWGAASGSLSIGGASSPPMAGRGAGTGGKKKGAMKKGTQLFSTSQRRSYR